MRFIRLLLLCLAFGNANAALTVDAGLARWTNTVSTATNVASGTFTTTTGALLVVCINSDESSASSTNTVQVNGGTGVGTWTERVRRGAIESNQGLVAIWTAPVTTGTAGITVNVQRPAGDAGSLRLSAKLYQVTGQHASPIGTNAVADWTTNPQNLTYTATGAGRAFGCGTDWNQTGTPTSSDTGEGADYAGAISVMSAYDTADYSSGTQGINFDPVGTPSGNVVVLEILAAAGGGATGTLSKIIQQHEH